MLISHPQLVRVEYWLFRSRRQKTKAQVVCSIYVIIFDHLIDRLFLVGAQLSDRLFLQDSPFMIFTKEELEKKNGEGDFF